MVVGLGKYDGDSASAEALVCFIIQQCLGSGGGYEVKLLLMHGEVELSEASVQVTGCGADVWLLCTSGGLGTGLSLSHHALMKLFLTPSTSV